eukprot:365305-Chlamydomonas_euryale.AAC.12
MQRDDGFAGYVAAAQHLLLPWVPQCFAVASHSCGRRSAFHTARPDVQHRMPASPARAPAAGAAALAAAATAATEAGCAVPERSDPPPRPGWGFEAP